MPYDPNDHHRRSIRLHGYDYANAGIYYVTVCAYNFKFAVTKRTNELRKPTGEKLWQRNYYEHIIRDNDDLMRIRSYIKTNPLRWIQGEDAYYVAPNNYA